MIAEQLAYKLIKKVEARAALSSILDVSDTYAVDKFLNQLTFTFREGAIA